MDLTRRRHPLVEPGEQSLWWCPECGGLYRKPAWSQGGDRFHSSHCLIPLEQANVTMEVAA